MNTVANGLVVAGTICLALGIAFVITQLSVIGVVFLGVGILLNR